MQTQTSSASASTATPVVEETNTMSLNMRVYETVRDFQPVTAQDVRDLLTDKWSSISTTMSKLSREGYLLVSKERISERSNKLLLTYTTNPEKEYTGQSIPPSTNHRKKLNNVQGEFAIGKTYTAAIYGAVSRKQPITSNEVYDLFGGVIKKHTITAILAQMATNGYLNRVKREGERAGFYTINKDKPLGDVSVYAKQATPITQEAPEDVTDEIVFDDDVAPTPEPAPTPQPIEPPAPKPAPSLLKKKVVVTYEFMGKEYTEEELRVVMSQLQDALGG